MRIEVLLLIRLELLNCSGVLIDQVELGLLLAFTSYGRTECSGTDLLGHC